MSGRRVGRPELREMQEGFLGGLNVTSDISQLAANELWRADDARLVEAGALTRRLGTRRVCNCASESSPVRGGHQYVHGSAVDQLKMVNGSLYRGVYAIGMSWTSVGDGFVADATPSFADFVDTNFHPCCYIADGGALSKLDDTVLTQRIAGTPNVSRIWVYNRRLLGTGNPANPRAVYWSAIDNGDTLGNVAQGGGVAIVLGDSDTGVMTSGRTLGQSTALFQETGIARFSGTSIDDIAIGTGAEGFSRSVGTVAPDAFVQYGNDANPSAVFLADNGIYEIDLEWRIRTLSTKIESVITNLDPSAVSRAVAIHNRAMRELWFYLPDVGVYVYNYRYVSPETGVGPWSGPFTGIYTSAQLYCAWEAKDATGKRIMLGGFGDGYVRLLDAPGIGLDDVHIDGTGGLPYLLQGQCHRMFFGEPTHEKSMKRLWVTMNARGSTNATIAWRTAAGAGQAPLSTGGGVTWGAGGVGWGDPDVAWEANAATTQKVDAFGRGPFVDCTITDDGAAEAIYSNVVAAAFDMGERG